MVGFIYALEEDSHWQVVSIH